MACCLLRRKSEHRRRLLVRLHYNTDCLRFAARGHLGTPVRGASIVFQRRKEEVVLMTRWTPLLANEFNRLQTEVNQLFDQFFGGRVTWPTLAYTYPAVNVWEDENNVYAEAELPGMEL